MTQYDFYNPDTHKGELPIRVLPYNYLDWFQNITPDFLEELKSEIKYNDLNPGIVYRIDRTKITDTAGISDTSEIELNENFNQYLWCICYSQYVLFSEGIEKPMRNGVYKGTFDGTDPFVVRANDVFNSGFGLLSEYSDKKFFDLPNPEKYSDIDKQHIEIANGVFSAAMTFILLHEYAHHIYGHVKYYSTPEESVKDELLADEYAIEKISHNFSLEKGHVFKFGIIAGLSALIIMSKSLSGGDSYPDSDLRLKVAIEKMDLEEMDLLWGIASLTFTMWSTKHGHKLDIPPIVDNFKQLFDLTLDAINNKNYR